MSDHNLSNEERAQALCDLIQLAAFETAEEHVSLQGALRPLAISYFVAGVMHARKEAMVPGKEEQLAKEIIEAVYEEYKRHPQPPSLEHYSPEYLKLAFLSTSLADLIMEVR